MRRAMRSRPSILCRPSGPLRLALSRAAREMYQRSMARFQPGERGAVMCDGLLVLAEVIQFQTFDLLLGAGNLFA